MTATITSKGQLTLPVNIREALGLHTGDKLDFHVTEEGRLEVEVVTGRLADLKGVLPKPYKSLTLKEIEAAIQRGGEL